MKWTCVICTHNASSTIRPELCSACGGIRSFAKVEQATAFRRAVDIQTKTVKRYSTSVGELDTALAGGIPAGATLLLWGRGGAGKSRGALRIGTQLGRCLCVSLEMTDELCRDTAASAGANLSQLYIERDEAIELPTRGFWCVVWDSISRTRDQDGTLTRLEAWAKRTGGIAIVVCHATKAGDFRGPSTLQHWPDAEIRMQQARSKRGMARARVLKSRFCECPASALVPIA